jgi:hypothetical protein
MSRLWLWQYFLPLVLKTVLQVLLVLPVLLVPLALLVLQEQVVQLVRQEQPMLFTPHGWM